MGREIDAIFDGGVLRPILPLNLPAGVVVRLHIDEDQRSQGQLSASEQELRRQQVTLDAMFEAVDRLPQVSCNDGLSGRDHDRILYGGAQ